MSRIDDDIAACAARLLAIDRDFERVNVESIRLCAMHETELGNLRKLIEQRDASPASTRVLQLSERVNAEEEGHDARRSVSELQVESSAGDGGRAV